MLEHFIPGEDTEEESLRKEVLQEWQEFYSQTGSFMDAFDQPIPEAVHEDELREANNAIKIKDVEEWVTSTGGTEKRFEFFECYHRSSEFYLRVAKPLLSMKCVGSMDAERAAKPLKHDILTKERNRLGHEKAELLLRTQTNLRYLFKLKYPDYKED